MSDAERVKGLLDGSMDPSELEDDLELYTLAERIYGRDALEEMGVTAPVRPPEVVPEIHSNGNNLEVELPEHVEEDDLPELKSKSSLLPSKRRVMLMAGVVGLVLVGVNVAVGLGQYLTLCEDQLESPPLSFTSTSNWQNDTFYITWTASNLNSSVNYSIYWSLSQNGSVEHVHSDWFNWTGSTHMVHSEYKPVTTPPWCYISTLYSEGAEIAQSNDCSGESSAVSTLAETFEAEVLCEDNTRLLWDKADEYKSIESWAPSGEGGLLDGALLMLFGLISLSGAFRRS